MGHPNNLTELVDQISAMPHPNKSTICQFDQYHPIIPFCGACPLQPTSFNGLGIILHPVNCSDRLEIVAITILDAFQPLIWIQVQPLHERRQFLWY
jgi:hypothetical protein